MEGGGRERERYVKKNFRDSESKASITMHLWVAKYMFSSEIS